LEQPWSGGSSRVPADFWQGSGRDLAGIWPGSCRSLAGISTRQIFSHVCPLLEMLILNLCHCTLGKHFGTLSLHQYVGFQDHRFLGWQVFPNGCAENACGGGLGLEKWKDFTKRSRSTEGGIGENWVLDPESLVRC
jgi:hypothetical protein